MKVLVTGFEPFGGETVNPAQQIVERLPQQVAGAQVVRRIVPCVFGRSIEAVRQAVEQERPDVVICIGQSGGRDAICPERVAINISDAASQTTRATNPSMNLFLPMGKTPISPPCPSRPLPLPCARRASPAKCPIRRAPMCATT